MMMRRWWGGWWRRWRRGGSGADLFFGRFDFGDAYVDDGDVAYLSRRGEVVDGAEPDAGGDYLRRVVRRWRSMCRWRSFIRRGRWRGARRCRSWVSDVLGDEFTVEAGVKALRERAAAHPEAEIGVVLLNQRVMAGLGNVYKSEVPFAAGVNPFRRCGRLRNARWRRWRRCRRSI